MAFPPPALATNMAIRRRGDGGYLAEAWNEGRESER